MFLLLQSERNNPDAIKDCSANGKTSLLLAYRAFVFTRTEKQILLLYCACCPPKVRWSNKPKSSLKHSHFVNEIKMKKKQTKIKIYDIESIRFSLKVSIVYSDDDARSVSSIPNGNGYAVAEETS